MRKMLRAWAIAALLGLGACACAFAAHQPLQLDVAKDQPVPLAEAGTAWIDESGQASPEMVADGTGITWSPMAQGGVYRIAPGKTLWVRFTVIVPGTERWYLQIPYPAVDKVTLYGLEGTGGWGQEAGDTIAVGDWPVPHRFPLLPLAPGPQQYLVRIQNTHSFGAPLEFVSDAHLLRDAQQSSVILGIYFGLAGLAMVLAMMSAVSLRDRSYALYAVSVLFMALTQASLTGIAGLNLWPDAPWWNDFSVLALPVLGVGSLQWFFSEVVSMRERSRLLHYTMAALGWLSLAAAAGIALMDPALRVKIMVGYISVAGTIGLLAVLWAARRGDRWASWLLVGSLPVAIGATFPMLRASGVIPVGFWATHGMQLGMSFELPIVLLILILRSEQRREHTRRLQGFDKIDPATGLLNATTFVGGLSRMMARSQRLKYQSAVLVVDIINADQIRRNYGARSSEELPLQVAGRLLASARDIDAVARLGEHRFGMLIEGPLSPEDAASEGPRIVARCLMPFKDKPIEWVAHVRVAQTIVPTQRADAKQVVERLEALLANVSPESKRAVFTLTS
ncbi:sensor domain-containing diguanylate cyclase [Ramlibacter sp. PS4R-6]|uniref:sensor domain-containing diguanylate cyclase n=1 Tax=Ramlibacter sp. PS4R-6 TaxID=3133438 RepID=UPI0030A27C4D